MYLLKKTALNLTALFIVLFFLLPLLSIFYQSWQADWENIQHLWQTVLTDYSLNSLLLVLGTVFLSLIFAIPAAWIISTYQFTGQKILQWVLCLPLAMPAYLVGYLYTDLLDYAGPVQSVLRQFFGWDNPKDYWFPSIRSLTGACFVLALVLYPYVFLLVRVALLEQSENLIHSAKTLGANAFYLFRKVTFPLIRPAIAAGASLVAMETLGDFGTVYYFAVPTLTTAVYDTWLGYGDLGSASQISLLMLFMIFSLLWLERYSRRKQKTYQRGYEKKRSLKPLSGMKLFLAQTYCWGLVSIAFVIPFIKLIYWAVSYFDITQADNFLKYAYHSLSSSMIAAVVCVLLALFLHFFNRLALQQSPRQQQTAYYGLQLSSLGYAVPGTVLAIGILIPYTSADHLLNTLFKSLGISPVGLIFSGSMFALLSAYTIRFSAMAIGGIETSFQKISPSLDMASRTLGHNGFRMLRLVHMPLLSKGILTALMMVFIETMKELNASLLLRPFNFDTLATHVFTFTSDEQLEQAALPAIALVLVGLLPVIWLTRSLVLNSEKDR
ncbi:Fe(3+) transport system permease protein FbpB [Pasteurella canis]|uniref:Fe(3+) transport system permease protein FbpB n=1 Tax=Pasteurella canis TaxID=753 RepID=A0A379ES96_9PAST|nr:iron ABC transporter permease [Pasteurella canis]SUC08829.1 Fe(3+) transport system permease protein FbpB [Pasteurella canis]